ncbi:ABC transporter permease [Embleya hyalina]|uniref:ABC transporter permease n=1 Tax=Embleya hyalina TaxID=516124 RepID=A0A401YZP0_9ACTN|nr:ABC transporter permease [Embleya hyalina]GCD99995.1 ABC transporter permease [Embleya hyalina]
MSTGGSTFWSAVRLVARREFTERIRDRGFQISVGVMLVILLASVAIPAALGGGSDKYDVAFLGPQQTQLAQTAERQAALLDVDVRVGTVADRAAAEKALADGGLDAVVDNGRILVDTKLSDPLAAVLQSAWATVERDLRLSARGIDPGAVNEASAIRPMPKTTLDPDADQRDTRKGIAFVGTLVLYGMLMVFCMWVASGVVEEKSSRIVEILLATVPARALLTGKVLGIGLLGLLQMLVTAVVGLAAASALGSVELTGAMIYPVALVLLWFVVGYALYACMFAAAAARVSRQEDLQNVITPMTSLLIGSFLAAVFLGQKGGTIAHVLAYVPPFSAMLQPAMTAADEVSVVENLVAFALALLALVGLVRLAARMYEGAVLRMGGKVGFKEALGAARKR